MNKIYKIYLFRWFLDDLCRIVVRRIRKRVSNKDLDVIQQEIYYPICRIIGSKGGFIGNTIANDIMIVERDFSSNDICYIIFDSVHSQVNKVNVDSVLRGLRG